MISPWPNCEQGSACWCRRCTRNVPRTTRMDKGMRVLFTSWAWRSHYFPSVPLGWAFAAAGHEVRMVSQPSLESTIVESGLPAVTVGSDPDLQATLNRGPSTSLEQTLKNLAAMLSSANEPMVDGLVRLARR